MRSKAILGVSTDDCALTARYWDTVTRRVDLGPERGVMTAVIKDAIMRYKKYCRKQDPRFQEAQHLNCKVHHRQSQFKGREVLRSSHFATRPFNIKFIFS